MENVSNNFYNINFNTIPRNLILNVMPVRDVIYLPGKKANIILSIIFL